MPIPIPMPRFSNSSFPGFCQYPIEKKEFAVEMKTFHDFLYLSGLLTRFPITPKETLLGIYKESTIKTLEQDMKHAKS